MTSGDAGHATLAVMLLGSIVLGGAIVKTTRILDNKGNTIERTYGKDGLEAANISALAQLKQMYHGKTFKRDKVAIPKKGWTIKVPQTVNIGTQEMFKSMFTEQNPVYSEQVRIKYRGNDELLAKGFIAVEAFSPEVKGLQIRTRARIPIDYGEGIQNERRTETFELIPNDQERKIDYLVVFDNSISMRKIRARIGNSLEGVLEAAPFSKNARMAAMTTLFGDPNFDYKKVHPKIPQSEKLRFEPGFLQLVSAESVNRYLTVNPDQRKYYKQKLCGPWFHPTEKTGSGFCLMAALQNKLPRVKYEAGMRALSQFITVQKQPVFRDHAIVNIIFISDTHEPGAKNPGWNYIPYSTIRAQILANSPSILGVRFHGLVPVRKRCTEEGLFQESYQSWITPSGGSIQHVCTKDYVRFFRNMALNSKSLQTRRIQLKFKPKSIVAIQVNGETIRRYPALTGGGWEIQDLVQDYDPSLPYRISFLTTSKYLPPRIRYSFHYPQLSIV